MMKLTVNGDGVLLVRLMQKKKWCFLFISLFVKGHFTCKSMEIDIIEGAITFIS